MPEGQIPSFPGGGDLGPGEGGQIPGYVPGVESAGISSIIELGDDTLFLNGALGQAGLDPITHIDDDNPRAFWCRVYWPPLRKAVLRMALWNFAESYKELALLSVPPVIGFSHAFALPPDCVKIREYNGATPDWYRNGTQHYWDNWMYWGGYYRVVGRHIYTNDSEVKISYTRDVTNPDLWDSLFYQVCEAWLASKLARQPGKQPDKAKELFSSVFGLLVPLATSADGQEGTVLPYITDDLIVGR